MPSPRSQSEWLSSKRQMQRLSRFQIIRQRLLLYHRGKFLLALSVLACFLFFRADLPSAVRTQSHLRFVKRPFPPSETDLEQWNRELKDPDEILLWAFQQFPGSLIQVTSFGASGMVLLDKMHRLGILKQIPAVTIDTLHLFDETYDLIGKVQKHYPELQLHKYTPKDYTRRQSFDNHYGAELYKTDPEKYGYITKEEPTERALEDLRVQAWMTGRRRSQGGERTHLPVVELANGRVKINPLALWSYEEVWNYLHRYKVPYNSLYDQGYKSIGDTMTSRTVEATAPERSGRFVGLNQTECGMHSHLQEVKRLKQEAADKDKEFVMPTLPCDVCHDVDLKTFQSDIVQSSRNILLEFYSPLCGACQEFSPTLKKIAEKVQNTLQVSRFDITESGITKEMEKQGFEVEVTPTMYLVQHDPLRLTLYEGDHSELDVMEWLARAKVEVAA